VKKSELAVLSEEERTAIWIDKFAWGSFFLMLAGFGTTLGLVCVTKNGTTLDWLYGAYAIFSGVFALISFIIGSLAMSDADRAREKGRDIRDAWDRHIVAGKNGPENPVEDWKILVPSSSHVAATGMVEFRCSWVQWQRGRARRGRFGSTYSYESSAWKSIARSIPAELEDEKHDADDPALQEAWTDFVFRVDQPNRENYERWKTEQERETRVLALPEAKKILT